jgi:hypothetical protein
MISNFYFVLVRMPLIKAHGFVLSYYEPNAENLLELASPNNLLTVNVLDSLNIFKNKEAYNRYLFEYGLC